MTWHIQYLFTIFTKLKGTHFCTFNVFFLSFKIIVSIWQKNYSSIGEFLYFHSVFRTSMKAFDAKFTFVHKTIWEKSIINQIWFNSFLHRFKTFMQLIVSTFEIKYWWFNTMLLRRQSFLKKKKSFILPLGVNFKNEGQFVYQDDLKK